MKALNVLIMVGLMFSLLVIVSPVGANEGPSVGVKEGDWMEYSVDLTGSPPALHDVNWMKMVVLQVEVAAFSVNLTVRYVNGTLYSSIWKFNFTAGNEEGWIIIPANLGEGDTFYDAFSANTTVVIQAQQQKTVLGATRAVTFTNSTTRHKEWDEATGVFLHSTENFTNWGANVTIIATNLWSPQIDGLEPTKFYAIIAAVPTAVAITALAIAFAFRKNNPPDR